ncbi:MAG TPA: hypothetical protein VF469_19810 [Kofleriaceae bacterium]
MNQERTDNPTAEALRLRANPELHGAARSAHTNADYQVSLSTRDGYFVLNWGAPATGTYDWIGLYQNSELPDSDYIGGNNWQWAVRGTSYKTATPAQHGYQARYLIWDAKIGAYKSVARSAPWAG